MDKIENCKWRICDRLGNDSLTTCYCTHPKMHFEEGKEFIAVNCDHTAECHRFEPKPVVTTVLCPCVRGEPCPIHPKPDEGRLLMDEEIKAHIIKNGQAPLTKDELRMFRYGAFVQDAKTASIFEARIEALIKDLESHIAYKSPLLVTLNMSWDRFKATHTSKGDEG